MEELLKQFKWATDVLEAHQIDYLVFGGIAVWAYGRRRQTRDIDLLVRKADAKKTLQALAQAGFAAEETDHAWIYKAALNGISIDIIFEPMGGLRLTPEILERERTVEISGVPFRIMDPENLVLLKILASKEMRPADWYDALSILKKQQHAFDWGYFMNKVAGHVMTVLSFAFFAQAESADRGVGLLVPDAVISELFSLYEQARGDQTAYKTG